MNATVYRSTLKKKTLSSISSVNVYFFMNKQMFKKLRINIPPSLVNGTQYSKEGAAELLACRLYTLLTNRKFVRYILKRL